ncbi:MAG: NAD(P)-binding domain-containing protein [Chloroflexota bacterium]
MNISVLGTGMVGQALASKLVALGHQVMLGSRSAQNEKGLDWQKRNGESASLGTFSDAARLGDIVIFAVKGDKVLEVAQQAGPEALANKVVVDVTNPLDFSQGMPPILIPAFSNTTSMAEELQKQLPRSRVVKTLNTMNCEVMVDPGRVPGQHDVFVSGDDLAAKEAVVAILRSFGWSDPIDLGALRTARATEGMMPFWLSLWGVVGHADFNYRIVRQEKSA